METIKKYLEENNLTISFAESITGGALAARLVLVAGASKVFSESYVAYSNDAKLKFGVTKQLIDQYGVVSKEVAAQMAKGLSLITQADIAVATTGNAGPTYQKDSNQLEAYVAVWYNSVLKCFHHTFDSTLSRKEVLEQTVLRAVLDIAKSLQL